MALLKMKPKAYVFVQIAKKVNSQLAQGDKV